MCFDFWLHPALQLRRLSSNCKKFIIPSKQQVQLCKIELEASLITVSKYGETSEIIAFHIREHCQPFLLPVLIGGIYFQ